MGRFTNTNLAENGAETPPIIEQPPTEAAAAEAVSANVDAARVAATEVQTAAAVARDTLASGIELASATDLRAHLAENLPSPKVMEIAYAAIKNVNRVNSKRLENHVGLAPEYATAFQKNVLARLREPDAHTLTPAEFTRELARIRTESVTLQAERTNTALAAAHLRLKAADTSPDKIACMEPITQALMTFIGENMHNICGDTVDTAITSGWRPATHKLSLLNEKSAHIGGMAFDMQLLRKDMEGSNRWLGATKLAASVKYLLSLAEKSKGLITVLLEYPGNRPRGTRKSRSPFANLPGFDRDVTFYNKHASGPHIHIQVNKAVFEQLPQPPPPAEVIRMASIGALSDAQAFEKTALGRQPAVTQVAALDQPNAEESLTPNATQVAADRLSSVPETPDNGA